MPSFQKFFCFLVRRFFDDQVCCFVRFLFFSYWFSFLWFLVFGFRFLGLQVFRVLFLRFFGFQVSRLLAFGVWFPVSSHIARQDSIEGACQPQSQEPKKRMPKHLETKNLKTKSPTVFKCVRCFGSQVFRILVFLDFVFLLAFSSCFFVLQTFGFRSLGFQVWGFWCLVFSVEQCRSTRLDRGRSST